MARLIKKDEEKKVRVNISLDFRVYKNLKSKKIKIFLKQLTKL